ncbi:MAG: hypothetical protein ACP5JH_00450 [Bacteroidota bacterium]
MLDPEYGCKDINHPVRECVESTGGMYHPCGYFVGARYCSETVKYGYPRYYYHLPIKVNPASLTFTAQYGGSNPSSQAFLILNGVSDLPFLRT